MRLFCQRCSPYCLRSRGGSSPGQSSRLQPVYRRPFNYHRNTKIKLKRWHFPQTRVRLLTLQWSVHAADLIEASVPFAADDLWWDEWTFEKKSQPTFTQHVSAGVYQGLTLRSPASPSVYKHGVDLIPVTGPQLVPLTVVLSESRRTTISKFDVSRISKLKQRVCGFYLFYQLGLALQEHRPHGFLQQHNRTRVHHPPPNRMGDEKTAAKNSERDSFWAGEIQNDHIKLHKDGGGKRNWIARHKMCVPYDVAW